MLGTRFPIVCINVVSINVVVVVYFFDDKSIVGKCFVIITIHYQHNCILLFIVFVRFVSSIYMAL